MTCLSLILSYWKIIYVLRNCNIQCPNVGCTYTRKGYEYDEVFKHLKTCSNRRMPCDNTRQESCPQRKLKCCHKPCKRLLTVQEKEEHERKCKFKEEECPHTGCKIVFAKKDKDKHMEVCEYVKYLCKDCNKRHLRKDIDNHLCSKSYPSENPNCGFTAPNKDVCKHANLRDDKQKCSICCKRIPKSELNNHLKECCKQEKYQYFEQTVVPR